MQQFDEVIFKQRVKERIMNGLRETDKELHQDHSMVSELESKTNISDVHFFSHRRFFGKIIVFSKRLLRKLLMPILNRQTDFNHNVVQQFYHVNELIKEQQEVSVSRLVDNMTVELSSMHKSIEMLLSDIKKQNEDLEDEKKILLSEISKQKNEIEDNKKTIQQLIEQVQNDIEDIEQLKKELYETQRKSIFEVYKELGDMERVQGNYQLSYQMQLMALKYASDEEVQEQKVLESFKLVNQSRNAEYDAI
ncbi:hypothetical protein PAALTS15_06684 [Paenibacillus alvei TS-15]|uniref:Uncharacterized protein n=1 Tax=Paenibacillus alvei TS-15 TaxID=1117108 RepID=S9ST74_PAEAL|nr:hypothetical protein [Paenibacillus alvei]EPY07909.1 hypothetical protein PAALTS15_06684 [Paenibacillus alvei TS-15]